MQHKLIFQMNIQISILTKSNLNQFFIIIPICRVRWASNKQNKHLPFPNDTSSANTNSHHGPSVFVVFLVYNKQKVVTEEILRSVFEAFGVVEDVVVKQSKMDPVSLYFNQNFYVHIYFMTILIFII
jgi:hypothetical protein